MNAPIGGLPRMDASVEGSSPLSLTEFFASRLAAHGVIATAATTGTNGQDHIPSTSTSLEYLSNQLTSEELELVLDGVETILYQAAHEVAQRSLDLLISQHGLGHTEHAHRGEDAPNSNTNAAVKSPSRNHQKKLRRKLAKERKRAMASQAPPHHHHQQQQQQQHHHRHMMPYTNNSSGHVIPHHHHNSAYISYDNYERTYGSYRHAPPTHSDLSYGLIGSYDRGHGGLHDREFHERSDAYYHRSSANTSHYSIESDKILRPPNRRVRSNTSDSISSNSSSSHKRKRSKKSHNCQERKRDGRKQSRSNRSRSDDSRERNSHKRRRSGDTNRGNKSKYESYSRTSGGGGSSSSSSSISTSNRSVG